MTTKEVAKFIIQWVKIETRIEMKEDQDFFDEAILDSLKFAQLVAALEDQFEVEVSFGELDDWSVVRYPLGLAKLLYEEQ